ncbi:MAG TPA: ABC transporter substrate-binding protein [Bacillota bacterium]|nr:ABC transporter substrate-binding protein [Bacillota bacterium]
MKKKFLVLTAILMAAAMVLVGCGGGEKAQTTEGKTAGAPEPVKFKIGHATWVGYGPLYIAKEKGLFKKYNIDPELLIVEDEAQYAAAVTSGELQGLCNVVDREVIHYAKGAPINFVLAMDESAGGDGIIATEAIKSVADLKGKTVGLDKSTTSYFFFLAALNKYGIGEKEVTIQEMSAGDAGAAFVAGKLDAAVTWEPWLSKAGERKGGHVLVSSKEFPKTIVDVITLRQDFAEANPQAVTGLVKAWFEAIEFYNANPDEGNKIMAKALALKEEELKDMASGVKFFTKEDNAKFFGDAAAPDSIWSLAGQASKFWQEKQIITEKIDINKLVKDQYVKEALK